VRQAISFLVPGIFVLDKELCNIKLCCKKRSLKSNKKNKRSFSLNLVELVDERERERERERENAKLSTQCQKKA
jgi:hypothetical protein